MGSWGPEWKAHMPWSLRLVGDEFAMDFIIVVDNEIADEDGPIVARLPSLFPESTIEHVTTAQLIESGRNGMIRHKGDNF
jgi:hypothetical protein